MALTGSSAASSNLYLRQAASNASRLPVRPDEVGARKRVVRVSHTVAAADGSGSTIVTADEMNLCILPPNCVLDLKESYVKLSATQGANTLILLGIRAYTKENGDAQAEDPDFIVTDIDGSATTIVQLSSKTAGVGADNLKCVRFNSRGPVTIFATASDGSGTYDGDVGDVFDYSFTYYVD